MGTAPEEAVGEIMNTFIRSDRLYEIKPDARLFGLDNMIFSIYHSNLYACRHPDNGPQVLSDLTYYKFWIPGNLVS